MRDSEWTAVHYAIAGEHIEIVKELFRRDLHNSPLVDLYFLAVKSGCLEMVRGFVGETSELFSPVCADIRKALLDHTLRSAVVHGHLDILIWLWKQDSSLVLDFEDFREHCVLFESAILVHVHLVEWILLQEEITIDVMNRDGLTVLTLMALRKANCNLETVKLLVVNGGFF
jgi:hypothetical protein